MYGFAALWLMVAIRCGLYMKPTPPRTTVVSESLSVHAKPARGPKFIVSGLIGSCGSRSGPKSSFRKSVAFSKLTISTSTGVVGFNLIVP